MSSATTISNGVVYIAGQKRRARDRFRVFDRAVGVGKELEDGSIADANEVWLSEWPLKNINNKFLLPINLEKYSELMCHIAKALVPLLQIWLSASAKAGSFEKRYEELCEILTLQKYPAPSQILRQFKPLLDELTTVTLRNGASRRPPTRRRMKLFSFTAQNSIVIADADLKQKNQTEKPIIVGQSEPVEPELPEPGTLDRNPISVLDKAGKLPRAPADL